MGCESVDSKFKAKSMQILALSRSSAVDSDPAPLYTWRPGQRRAARREPVRQHRQLEGLWAVKGRALVLPGWGAGN